jgi:Uma2 family endonuclease
MSTVAMRTRRWNVVEYERMIERGIFRDDERLELLDGQLVVKEPQGNPHAVAVDLAVAALRQAFGPAWLVRAHAPLALGRRSRPEPDVSVVPGSPRDYRSAAPTGAALVVEISQSSLGIDRTRKATIYARARIPEYWVVNLTGRAVEVHRDPAALDASGRHWTYRSVDPRPASASITPIATPGARIAIGDLLP